MSRCFEAETRVGPSDDYGLAREGVSRIWQLHEKVRVDEVEETGHGCGGGLSDRMKSLLVRVNVFWWMNLPPYIYNLGELDYIRIGRIKGG